MLNVLIWANCQGGGVEAVLPKMAPVEINARFLSNYKYISGEFTMDRDELIDIVHWADVLIYQPLVASHGFYSTVLDGSDNIRSRLRKDSRSLSFGTSYNDGLWPFFYEGEVLKNGRVIDRMFREGASPQDVIDRYDRGELNFGLKQRSLDSLDLMKRLETMDRLDVQVHSFVKDRLFSEYLFLTQNHPTTLLFAEIGRQICQALFDGKFREPAGEWFSDSNFSKLPGRWPVDRYCIDELGLTSVLEPDDNAADFYRGIITKHYEARLKSLE